MHIYETHGLTLSLTPVKEITSDKTVFFQASLRRAVGHTSSEFTINVSPGGRLVG